MDAGYGSLIRTYVQFILAKLRFHRLRPEFNGLFEYEEYISLKGIDDPNEGYVHPLDLIFYSNFLAQAMRRFRTLWDYKTRLSLSKEWSFLTSDIPPTMNVVFPLWCRL